MNDLQFIRVEVYDRRLFHQHQQYDVLAGLHYLYQLTLVSAKKA